MHVINGHKVSITYILDHFIGLLYVCIVLTMQSCIIDTQKKANVSLPCKYNVNIKFYFIML